MYAGTAADIKAMIRPIKNPPRITLELSVITSSIKPPLKLSMDGIRIAVKNSPDKTAVKHIVMASKITEMKIVESL